MKISFKEVVFYILAISIFLHYTPLECVREGFNQISKFPNDSEWVSLKKGKLKTI